MANFLGMIRKNFRFGRMLNSRACYMAGGIGLRVWLRSRSPLYNA